MPKSNKPLRVEQQWNAIAEGRECGTCFACCIHLGIEALHKYSGQSCKHLTPHDHKVNLNKRCGIYLARPRACEGYHCFWVSGFGPENLKPSESGILITPYESEMPQAAFAVGMGRIAYTVMIFDPSKAAAHDMGQKVVTELLSLGAGEVRLVNMVAKTALLFAYGTIFKCLIEKPDSYEALNFRTISDPVGHYEIAHLPKNNKHKEPQS